MIEVEHLSKSFNGQPVLEDLSFSIAEGDILVILGESGSGKSVLLKHLIGILKPDQGAVRIKGKDIVPLSEKKLLKIRRDIGYLFQEGALYDFMTVYENVAFPLKEHTAMKRREIVEKVTRILTQVGLSGALAKYPAELSGGMKKRAALARAVILDSKILLCDEPTSGLDPIKSREISDLIHGICRDLKCTTIIASHDMENSLRIADRMILLRKGRIVARGSPDDMKASQDAFIQEFLT
ncbi:MAG: ATP-binding cassette domain-containing protein [Candidatus Omnitrophota bacterium]|jgi:phospholipid/cholesterol/gamma-HCH transport system ATP-binding protein